MEIDIQPKRLNQIQEDLLKRESLIRRQADELHMLYQQLQKTEDEAMRILAEKLKKQYRSLEEQCRKLQVFSKALEKLACMYRQNEERIEEQGEGIAESRVTYRQLSNTQSVRLNDLRRLLNSSVKNVSTILHS